MAIFAISTPAAADQSISYLTSKDLNLQETQVDSYEWKLGVKGYTWDEDSERSIGISTKLGVKVEKFISPILNVKFDGGLKWGRGNSQLEFSQDYSKDNFFASEVTLNLLPSEYFTFSAGAINQGFLNADLLIAGGRSFPGLLQKLSIYKEGKYEFGLIAQQSIPTGTSFNLDRTEKEEVPMFYTGTLFADYTVVNLISQLPTEKLNLHIAASTFQFNDLPAVLADKGARFGHFGPSVGDGANSRFKYDFSGYLIESSVSLEDENNYEVKLGGYWADNLSAKQNDRLQSISLEGNKTLGQYKLQVGVENFFKDSEVSPSAYSSFEHGSNNRIGNIYSTEVQFTKYNFKIEAKYYDLGLITEHAGQGERTAYYLGVETLYVEF